VFPYFRSNDLWGGLPVNLASIAILQKWLADEIDVEVGEMIYSSKGLHIYKYCEELAKLRTNKN
jgi:thymidylate synthase